MDPKELHREAKDRYWKDKDLSGARSLLEHGILAAREQEMFGEEKAMNFDLASFCWPGWDEPGISISEDDLARGERAADENLRLAIELKRGPGPMANAWFMVGAYHLSRGRFEEASRAFADQEQAAKEAEDAAGVLLAQGYVAIATRLGGKQASWQDAANRLRDSGFEHGGGFAEQLETAARVFGV